VGQVAQRLMVVLGTHTWDVLQVQVVVRVVAIVV